MQMSGSSRATRFAKPAFSAAATTAVRSLWAPGASSAMPRVDGLLTISRELPAHPGFFGRSIASAPDAC